MSELSFGKRLELRRKNKGYTQGYLAEMLGKKHRMTISSWETGKAEPSMSELQQLATLLNTTVGYLVDGTPEGEGIPKGYKLVQEEELIKYNRQLIDLQEQLISYQQKEIDRNKS
ncbi:helix-turn-helix domain-containing protein [Fibrella forsythiae]|uniref:Helix-turn-helix transcriptional regulator n=1 Tax=Fibrella forsythiae TaxID=2817061 RepID=A0ABS3JSJ7_9BACT|nr:helix-turn-helix transcriptional regulator [Fibrella forsythiae]MBO0952992.1 helix-turn-helix transcriptional regulator [Fibrella forsythiae]